MKTDPRTTPWDIDESEFYEMESREERLAFLLRYAVLAPSSHNTQPWSFRIKPQGIAVYADYSRRLSIADSKDRELWMSVGAAITNLRVAAAWFGFESEVIYEQRPEESLPIGMVTLRETCAADEELRRLFPSIRKRHTNRQPYQERTLDPSASSAICDVADRFPDTIRLILSHDKPRIGEVVAIADQREMARDAVREELAKWIRPADSESTDGMCVDGLGIPAPFERVFGWLTRHFDLGAVEAARDRRFIENAPALILITAADERVSLVKAGEALEILLLTMVGHGVQYSFFNHAIENDGLRQRIWVLSGAADPPQLLLRAGYADPVRRPMPRRPVDAVLQKAWHEKAWRGPKGRAHKRGW